jgi:hypothetical protein
LDARVKINDKPLRKLASKLSKGGYVRVGVLQGSGKASTGNLTMIHLAAIHEFGSPSSGIPERSFIRRTFNDRSVQADLSQLFVKLATAIVTKNITNKQYLNAVGAWGTATIKKTITQGAGVPPPLAPATIERKGSSRPLVDKGRLLNAITWQIVE